MELGLRDKVVLITGASGGIGRALCTAFAEEGARLVLTGRSRFVELEGWLAAQPWRDRALACSADAAQPVEIAGVFERGAQRFGRIDVAVANAGHWPREHLLLHRASEERIRDALQANLFSALWTARAFFAELERAGPRADGHGAALVCIGSTAGRFGERNHAEYAIAKSGLYGLVRSLKNEIVELDPFGRVNLVEPGWTVTHNVRAELDTPGVLARVARTMPLRQLARAEDIARTVLFLASPLAARHISGEFLTVAGGMEGRVRWELDEIDEQLMRRRLQPGS